MQNSGIFLRKMIEIVAEGDTFILHFAFFILHFYRAIGSINRNLNRYPLQGYQKFTTSALFSCSCSLSAIRAINSELVGLPLVLLTV